MNISEKLRGKRFQDTIKLLFCVLCVLWLFWPRTFQQIMPGLELSEVTDCRVDYFISSIENGVPVTTIQTRSFTPDSEDFAQLIELLKSSRYRYQLSNVFAGGALNQYSLTLSPYAEITFTQGNKQYEFNLFGKDIPAGQIGKKCDYSAWKGLEFQMEVIAFVGSYGTLIEAYTF